MFHVEHSGLCRGSLTIAARGSSLVSMTTNAARNITAEIEFRCTRFDLYAHNCIGRDDVTARQGHYFDGASFEEAAEEMALRWPNDTIIDIQDVSDPKTVVRFFRTKSGMKRM